MASSRTSFPECCRYCPHHAEFTGSCTHELRQTLIEVFAYTEPQGQSCPVYAEWHGKEMVELAR
jgi:hypothetical protein